jgi:hypothetical protein
MPQATRAATWPFAGRSRREGARVADVPVPVATCGPFSTVPSARILHPAVTVLQPLRMNRQRSDNVTSYVTTPGPVSFEKQALNL